MGFWSKKLTSLALQYRISEWHWLGTYWSLLKSKALICPELVTLHTKVPNMS